MGNASGMRVFLGPRISDNILWQGSRENKMKNNLYYLALVFFLFLFTGCSGDSSATIGKTADALQGDWQWLCVDISDATIVASYQAYDQYNNGAYSGEYNVYATSDCTDLVQATNSVSGTYTIGEKFNSTNSPGLIVTEADFNLPNVNTSGDLTYLQLIESIVPWGSGGIFFDTFYITGSRIYWSDYATGEAISPATRPTAVNLSTYAERI